VNASRNDFEGVVGDATVVAGTAIDVAGDDAKVDVDHNRKRVEIESGTIGISTNEQRYTVRGPYGDPTMTVDKNSSIVLERDKDGQFRMVVLSGTANVFINGKRVEVKAGQILAGRQDGTVIGPRDYSVATFVQTSEIAKKLINADPKISQEVKDQITGQYYAPRHPNVLGSENPADNPGSVANLAQTTRVIESSTQGRPQTASMNPVAGAVVSPASITQGGTGSVLGRVGGVTGAMPGSSTTATPTTGSPTTGIPTTGIPTTGP
jgi:hypothetical protein